MAPQPGTVNYVEGQASVEGQTLNEKSIGSRLAAGQLISTQNGRAELLLTPGIFFRIGGNSAAQMVSPGLSNTVVLMERGRALVEVAEIHPENNIRINQNGASTQLLKPGLYDFDADHGLIRVFDGEAAVQVTGQEIKLKGGHQLNLNDPQKLKARGFDKKAYQDDFYRWASLRSSYMAEANADAARSYGGGTGVMTAGWYGTGWYWDPWFDAYTFIPDDGIFYSPFGWGFYSPWLAFGAPYFGGYGYYHHFGPGYHAPYRAGMGGAGFSGHAFNVPGHGFAGRSGAFGGSGFRGGSGGFRGGSGFRGGAGGFHGGGGGGFHGGGGGGSHGGGGGHGR